MHVFPGKRIPISVSVVTNSISTSSISVVTSSWNDYFIVYTSTCSQIINFWKI